MVLGLRTAIYPVPDLAAGKAWYSRVLGREPYFDQPFYVGFSVAGGSHAGAIHARLSSVTQRAARSAHRGTAPKRHQWPRA